MTWFTDCFKRITDRSIRVCQSCNLSGRAQDTANICVLPGPPWATPLPSNIHPLVFCDTVWIMEHFIVDLYLEIIYFVIKPPHALAHIHLIITCPPLMFLAHDLPVPSLHVLSTDLPLPIPS